MLTEKLLDDNYADALSCNDDKRSLTTREDDELEGLT